MIKFEFPADNKQLAGVIGKALSEYAGVIKFEPEFEGITLSDLEHDLSPDSDVADTSHIEKTIPASEGGTFDSRVDTNNVSFNAEFCGEAREPFYASGKNKGQWKKRKGVNEEDYAAWYDAELTATAPTDEPQDDTPLDTAGAFGGDSQTQNTSKPAPKDCGEFMHWVSSQQAAGRINQLDVTDAFAKLKIQMTDLFPPNDAGTVAGHVANLFAVLGGLE